MKIDACIWQSAFNILQAQENLNKLFEAFDLIECQGADFVIKAEDADDCEGDFIQPVWNAYYSVRRSRRKNAKVDGWVTLAIQLTCSEGVEADWDFGKRAKVLVGYSPLRSFEDAWGFDADSPNSAGYREDCEITETYWRIDDGKDGVSWFYSIPLDEMTSVDAVRKLIVDPLHEILQSSDPQKPNVVLKRIEGHLCRPPNQ